MCALLNTFCCDVISSSIFTELHEVDDALIVYRPTGFSVWWMLGSMFLCFLSVFCKEHGLTVLVSILFSRCNYLIHVPRPCHVVLNLSNDLGDIYMER